MALKDVNGNPLVIGKKYRIRVKNEDMLNNLRSDQLRESYAHNKLGTLTELLTVGDDIPSGIFKLEDDDDGEITLNNYDCTFTRCMDLTCSVSGGKRRTRRTRRTIRSKRRRSRRFA